MLKTQLEAVLWTFHHPQLLSLGLLEDMSPPLAVGAHGSDVQEFILPIFQSAERI